MTIAHFKIRLEPEIQNELILYYITTSEKIYRIAQDMERYVRPSAPRPQDLRHIDMRSTLGGQLPRVGPEPSRNDPVLNRRKEETKVRSLGSPNRCYKCGGVGHHSKICSSCKEYALCLKDIIDEEVHGDQ